MTTTDLEQLIHESGQDWLIRSYVPQEDAIPHLVGLLDEVDIRAKQRWGENAPRMLEWLPREARRNPHKIKAFFQALGATDSPDMLLMVWRVLEGRTVAGIELAYKLQQRFKLKVILSAEGPAAQECYESTSIDDAALLRHFGIMTMDDKPIFDGFYPL